MAIIDKRSVSSQIIDYILDQIIQGNLKKGDKITNEREFAEMLGVSRVPLREAISALSLIGILTPKQGDGTFVNSYNPEIFDRAIYATVIMENTSIDDIMRVRCMIESNAAELASVAATAEDIAAMEQAGDAHEAAVETYLQTKTGFEQIIEADDRFHSTIAEATHNPFFKQFFDVLRHSIRYCMLSCQSQPETFTSFVDAHRAVIQAIREHRGAAAYVAMHDHIADYSTPDSGTAQTLLKSGFYEYQKKSETLPAPPEV